MSTPYIANTVRNGDWIATCDVCGRPYLASTLKTRWDGAKVDSQCWDPYPDSLKSPRLPKESRPSFVRPTNYVADPNSPQLDDTFYDTPDNLKYWMRTWEL